MRGEGRGERVESERVRERETEVSPRQSAHLAHGERRLVVIAFGGASLRRRRRRQIDRVRRVTQRRANTECGVSIRGPAPLDSTALRARVTSLRALRGGGAVWE